MSKRLLIKISIPEEGGSCSFKMKTRAYGDKKEMINSIKEEFLANPEDGLVNQIAKRVGETFGIPSADEIVSTQQMTSSTQMGTCFNKSEPESKNLFFRKFLAGDNVWCEVNHDGQGGLWLHIGNSHEGHPDGNKTAVHFLDKDQFFEFCKKIIKGNVNE